MLIKIGSNHFNLKGLTKVSFAFSDKTRKNYTVLSFGGEKREFIEVKDEAEHVANVELISNALKD